ncbi:MAG: DNA-binding NtrC family response regulator [Verrucomicrobiales bacterium]|jgi:DNA-binding NtrC family response regulator
MITLNENNKKGTLLVVEDEKPLLQFLVSLLSKEYHVFAAGNALEAGTIVERQAIDVVICDHEMPGEKGLDFLTRMRTAFPKLQRILLTGHTGSEVVMKAINEGDVLKFLPKPSSPKEVFEAVEMGLEAKAAMERSERAAVENEGLRKQIEDVPSLANKMAKTTKQAWKFLGTALLTMSISAASFLVLGTVAILALYVLKTWIGVSLFEDMHFEDIITSVKGAIGF